MPTDSRLLATVSSDAEFQNTFPVATINATKHATTTHHCHAGTIAGFSVSFQTTGFTQGAGDGPESMYRDVIIGMRIIFTP